MEKTDVIVKIVAAVIGFAALIALLPAVIALNMFFNTRINKAK